MDRKLNKKELKFLQKLGVKANEDSSLSEIQGIFKQNIPIEIENENIQNSTADTNKNFVPNPVEMSTILASLEKNQNIPIENKAEKVQKSSDTNQNSVQSPVEISASVFSPNDNQNTPNSAAPLAIATNSAENQNVPIVSNKNEFMPPLVEYSVFKSISTETSKCALSSENNNAIDSVTTVSNTDSVNNNNTVDSAKANIASNIETTAIVPPIVSHSVQTVTHSVKTWSQIMDEDQSKQLVPKTSNRIDESDYVEDTEIEQRIQQENDKLKLYASQIDRLKKQLTIIEHQREIALLNLDILGATLPEENAVGEPKVTKSSVPIAKPSKSSELNRQQLPGPSTSSQIQTDSEILCFNCSTRGHKSFECTQPRREKGSCFKCGSKLHILQDCPLKKRHSEFRSNREHFKYSSSDSDWDDSKVI